MQKTIKSYEIASETKATRGVGMSADNETEYTARNWVIISHKESSENSFPGHTLIILLSFYASGHDAIQLTFYRTQTQYD